MTNRPRTGRAAHGLAWRAALAVCVAAWLPGLAPAQDTLPRPWTTSAPSEAQAAAKPAKGAEGGEPIVDPAVVRIGCSSCSNGLLGPPAHDDGHYIGPGPTGCGTGQCVPGLKKCHCADCSHCETYFGRLLCGFYDCICCPDPCYEPHWCPLVDTAFFQDSARPQTQIRFRYESGWNFQNPDRAEWFRARANTQPAQAQPGVTTALPGAGKGPPYIVETLDYQTFHMYTEAGTPSFGFFTDIAYQSNSPRTAVASFTLLEQQLQQQRQRAQQQLRQNQQQLQQNQQQLQQAQNQQQAQQLNQRRRQLQQQRQQIQQQLQQNMGVLTGGESGFADMTLGTKSVLIDCELLLTTFQFKVFLPTGNFTKGIGTGHVSLEPSLLFAIKLLPNLYLQGQLAYWFPVGGDQLYEGNVFHTHLALNKEIWQPCPGTRLVGTMETNFWNVFNGAYTSPNLLIPNPARATAQNAPQLAPVALPAESSIVSVGPGLRLFCCDRVDMGVGSAIAVTGNHWEKQVLRVDFRWRF